MAYTQSILDTVRGAMGLVEDDSSFDSELIIHINSHPQWLATRDIIIKRDLGCDFRCLWHLYLRTNLCPPHQSDHRARH